MYNGNILHNQSLLVFSILEQYKYFHKYNTHMTSHKIYIKLLDYCVPCFFNMFMISCTDIFCHITHITLQWMRQNIYKATSNRLWYRIPAIHDAKFHQTLLIHCVSKIWGAFFWKTCPEMGKVESKLKSAPGWQSWN